MYAGYRSLAPALTDIGPWVRKPTPVSCEGNVFLQRGGILVDSSHGIPPLSNATGKLFAATGTKTRLLYEEIHAIHAANMIFWRDANPAREAVADYYARQDRLEETRVELSLTTRWQANLDHHRRFS
jgi:hypothetical protein